MQVRFARATDHLDDALRFYRDGLGLDVLGSFVDHEGFDGVMLDDANNDPTGPLGGRTLAKYPTPQSYAGATSNFLQNVCGQVRAAGFLALPNVKVCGGSWLTPADAVAAKDWARITALAKEASALRR